MKNTDKLFFTGTIYLLGCQKGGYKANRYA